MSEFAYEIGVDLCAFARSGWAAVGIVDSNCRCEMRGATTSTVFSRFRVNNQDIMIRSLGGSLFEIIDDGKPARLDSSGPDRGSACKAGEPIS